MAARPETDRRNVRDVQSTLSETDMRRQHLVLLLAGVFALVGLPAAVAEDGGHGDDRKHDKHTGENDGWHRDGGSDRWRHHDDDWGKRDGLRDRHRGSLDTSDILLLLALRDGGSYGGYGYLPTGYHRSYYDPFSFSYGYTSTDRYLRSSLLDPFDRLDRYDPFDDIHRDPFDRWDDPFDDFRRCDVFDTWHDSYFDCLDRWN